MILTISFNSGYFFESLGTALVEITSLLLTALNVSILVFSIFPSIIKKENVKLLLLISIVSSFVFTIIYPIIYEPAGIFIFILPSCILSFFAYLYCVKHENDVDTIIDEENEDVSKEAVLELELSKLNDLLNNNIIKEEEYNQLRKIVIEKYASTL